ncbi:CPBP family intramembrane glutamic endopeptidase [Aureibacter tunicatorum]|uniref:Membrane protease YdiL (CAAX protease family) n=1 Tax=Aureibacter tunicatorum TaxID=866807 RepID=A0AAE4BUF4_9BACT|nr:CPBP family intramembrane glutamic endopeptidase [Aureibacter tunicatorum]MDR6240687.1 membrane protease YdiL (CAAX protease family) [Aureibacter tunicatorum]BDD06980.1 hypothetical protein AUTU_44630 [Aureibacter tunicatorum]
MKAQQLKAIGKAIVIFGVNFIAIIAISYYFADYLNNTTAHWLSIFVNTAFILIYLWMYDISLPRFLNSNASLKIKQFALILLLSIAFISVKNIIYASFQPEFYTNSKAVISWSLFRIVLISPLIEEFLFRNMILKNMLDNEVGLIPALLLSSCLFALLHPVSWLWLLSSFVSGMFYGYLFYKFKHYSAPTTAHAFHNFAVELIPFINI